MTEQGPFPPEFPYEQLALDHVAILFDLVKDKVDPPAQHRDLPLPEPPVGNVVIALDGIGSSSAGLAIADLVDWIQADTDFDVCVFSYLGLPSRRYEPRDTVRTDFDRLVQYLDQYIARYANADCIVLLGYSFGGLIISEWLYRHRREFLQQQGQDAPVAGASSGIGAVRGSALITSPIRLSTTRVFYRHQFKRGQGPVFVSALLEGYTAIPEAVPVIAPMVLFIAEDDGLLHQGAYTFRDRSLEDRPGEILLRSRGQKDPTTHFNIVIDSRLRTYLKDVLPTFCKG